MRFNVKVMGLNLGHKANPQARGRIKKNGLGQVWVWSRGVYMNAERERGMNGGFQGIRPEFPTGYKVIADW